ncbi:MAG: hypothetical protein HYZ00_07920 [Candidatus Hydrogenedentes bacterium]|nr:hypothetical protein [Candidatus Hydrogenedentota bacterium]
MNHPPRVHLFCNVGVDLPKLSSVLRAQHGEIYLVALVGRDCKPKEKDRAAVDEFRRLAARRFGLLSVPLLIWSALQLRREGVDTLVMLFDSLKLRVLAAIIHPARCVWWRADGYNLPLPASLSGTLAEFARFRLRGFRNLVRSYSTIRFGKY